MPCHIPYVAGPYKLREGNLVRPLIDGVPAFRRIGEAVAAARHSVWITVTFVTPDFPMPPLANEAGGTFFDLLDRTAARGLDVRVLFWRPNPASSDYGKTFAGTPADHALLAARRATWSARWDRAPAAFCQHQKSWLIDAGNPGETAFIGGINLSPGNSGIPGHASGDLRHDAYVEITGPSATDAHHNFAQRWNMASERLLQGGSHNDPGDLPLPTAISPPRGATPVQIQRMLPANHYPELPEGEHTIRAQYHQAIAAARHAIYLENQAIPIPDIAASLESALQRGVEIALTVPADPEPHIRAARANPAGSPSLHALEALGRHDNFTLVGLVAPGGPVYVHGKLMLVDDLWATIGSCNLHANSMGGHGEMNASFHDAALVHALRCQLLAEHLSEDTSALHAAAALRRLRAGGGLAVRLEPREYGK